MGMYNSPRRFIVPLQDNTYQLEVDVLKAKCSHYSPHWHLTRNGSKIAKIWISNCQFDEAPIDLSPKIIAEVVNLTGKYAMEINQTYRYNSTYGIC